MASSVKLTDADEIPIFAETFVCNQRNFKRCFLICSPNVCGCNGIRWFNFQCRGYEKGHLEQRHWLPPFQGRLSILFRPRAWKCNRPCPQPDKVRDRLASCERSSQ